MTRKRIDWAAVRESRTRLAQLAREHPELTGPPDPENVAAWENILRTEETMVRKMSQHTAFRLPPELLERMDEFAEKLAQRTGLRVSRADVARLAIERLLTEGIGGAVGGMAAEPKRGKR